MFNYKYEKRRPLGYLFSTRIMFFSFGKHWKGVYLHFFPNRCHRIFFATGCLQHDSHLKDKTLLRLCEQEMFIREQDKALGITQ